MTWSANAHTPRLGHGDLRALSASTLPYTRAMKARVAVALLMSMIGAAAADGERTPMLGAAITYAEMPDRKTGFVGGELELAWWYGRVGLAVEAAARRGIDEEGARNLALAGSARVLVTSWMWPSLFDARDVEVAVELHAIAERTWWTRDDSADALGLGLALRMRGGSDWEFSGLLAESRLFVRVMSVPDDADDAIARAAGTMLESSTRRGVSVLVGLGAAFGAGKPSYLERFRRKSFDGP